MKKSIYMMTAFMLMLSCTGCEKSETADVPASSGQEQQSDLQAQTTDMAQQETKSNTSTHMKTAPFTATVEVDDSEPEYIEKTIRVLYGLPDGIVKNEEKNAINAYLEEHGYDFQVELVGNNTGELYVDDVQERKKEGLPVDIVMDFIDDRQEFETQIESGAYLKLDELLDTESGSALLQGINTYMTTSGQTEQLEGYLDAYRAADGSLYGLPMYMSFSAPYLLCYGNGALETAGISELSGTLSDLELVVEHAEQLKEQQYAPMVISKGSTEADYLLGNTVGLENYETWWLLDTDEDGTVTAVDLFQNTELMNWYLQLGQWREDDILTYSNAKEVLASYNGEDLTREIDDYGKIGFAFVPGANQTFGWYNLNGTSNISYDVLNVQTTFPVNTVLCLDSETQYPQECLEFLKLLYSDLEFRRLLYKGPEGWGYYVDTSGETDVLVNHTVNRGIPLGLGLGEDCLIYEEYNIPYYHQLVEYAYEANASAVPSAVSVGDGIDFSGVAEEYQNCVAIFSSNSLVFWGVYGDRTEEKLMEVYEKLQQAGYQKVLDTINEQLGE
jgi:hypothetical protein